MNDFDEALATAKTMLRTGRDTVLILHNRINGRLYPIPASWSADSKEYHTWYRVTRNSPHWNGTRLVDESFNVVNVKIIFP